MAKDRGEHGLGALKKKKGEERESTMRLAAVASVVAVACAVMPTNDRKLGLWLLDPARTMIGAERRRCMGYSWQSMG